MKVELTILLTLSIVRRMIPYSAIILFPLARLIVVTADNNESSFSPFITKETASLFLAPARGQMLTEYGGYDTCSGGLDVIGDTYLCSLPATKGTYHEETYRYISQTSRQSSSISAVVDTEIIGDFDERVVINWKKAVKQRKPPRGIRPRGNLLWHKQSRMALPPKPCASNPCKNSATCDNIGGSYSCICVDGYTGTHCETDIDECSSSPCQNQGFCHDNINHYTCSCTEDFQGTNCEIDNCAPNSLYGADIVFVVDSSLSQTDLLYEKQKQYMKTFISEFPIGPNDFQIAIVSFSYTATIHAYLNTYSTNSSIIEKIDNMTATNGPSYTGEGLKTAREEILTSANGKRSVLPAYVIVLTNGLSSNPTDTVYQAGLVKMKGVDIFSVAFGEQIYHKELSDISMDISTSRKAFPSIVPDAVYSILKKHMPICPDCFRNTSDVVILFDASTDLPIGQFYNSIDSLRALVEGMPIGPTNVHVSYIKYAQDVHEEFSFTQYQTKDEVMIELSKRLTQHFGPANVSKALDYVTATTFGASKGSRSNTRKMAVLYTQGSFDDYARVGNSAKALKNAGVTIVAIGLGNTVNMTALLDIASDPAYVFVLGDIFKIDYDVLSFMSSSFEFDVCEFD